MVAIAGAKRSSRGFYAVNCPFCVERVGKEDRDRTLSVNERNGQYRCFRCGAKGFLRNGELQRLVDRAESSGTKTSTEKAGPPHGFFFLTENLDAPSLAEAINYLRGRGLSDSLIAEARIGACVSGRYSGRIVIPILGADGSWLGFSARDWTGRARAKYLYPSWMKKAGLLYNARALDVETDVPAFLVEGCFDALALWPDAVASLGMPGDAQIEILSRSRRPVCSLLDGDMHGRGWAVAMRLRLEGLRAGSVRLPPMKDPDELPRNLIEWAGARAIVSAEAEEVLSVL